MVEALGMRYTIYNLVTVKCSEDLLTRALPMQHTMHLKGFCCLLYICHATFYVLYQFTKFLFRCASPSSMFV